MNSAVDIVIPTYDNAAELSACLDALDREATSGIRALVCIDGSTDGTSQFLAARRGPFAIVVLEHDDHRNHGRSVSRNLALPLLDAPFVLLLDSDMVLQPFAVQRHLDLMATGVGASVGDVRYVGDHVGLWARYQATRGRHKVPRGSRIRPLDFTGANTMLRRDDLLAVGGFDESLTAYGGEDTELGLRLAEERGLTFVFNDAAVATTVEYKTTHEAIRQLDAYARTGLRRIRARHPTGPAPFWVDRLESDRISGRLLRLLSNPLLDWLARALLPVTPFVVQRRLLDYLVFRTIARGYLEGPQ